MVQAKLPQMLILKFFFPIKYHDYCLPFPELKKRKKPKFKEINDVVTQDKSNRSNGQKKVKQKECPFITKN